jgi:PPOX class probable F420-dependent enzyme
MSLNAIYDRVRHPHASRAGREEAAAGGFESLRDRKHCLLVTFRRSGEPIATPMWFGLDGDGRAYIRTAGDAPKVKRIANDPRVRLAPCSPRGKPLGPPVEGRARVVPVEEEEHAERALQSNYGLGRRVYRRVVAREGFVYLEVTPE